MWNDVTVADFELIEDLLEAFGKPRDLVLTLLYSHGILGYAEYVAEVATRKRRHPRHAINDVAVTIIQYLTAMARYFIKDQILKPEIWELKTSKPT